MNALLFVAMGGLGYFFWKSSQSQVIITDAGGVNETWTSGFLETEMTTCPEYPQTTKYACNCSNNKIEVPLDDGSVGYACSDGGVVFGSSSW